MRHRKPLFLLFIPHHPANLRYKSVRRALLEAFEYQVSEHIQKVENPRELYPPIFSTLLIMKNDCRWNNLSK